MVDFLFFSVLLNFFFLLHLATVSLCGFREAETVRKAPLFVTEVIVNFMAKPTLRCCLCELWIARRRGGLQ